MADEMLPVRDFVYLDVERLKSILAQVDEGYIEQLATSAGTSQKVEGGAEVQVPLLAKLGGTGQYVATNQATETRTLHDHIYNYVEMKLAETGRLLRLDEHLSADKWLSDADRQMMPRTAFVLVKGSPLINDYAYLKQFLLNFNKIGSAIGRLAAQDKIKDLPKAKAKEAQALAAKEIQLPQQTVSDLDVVLKAFVRTDTVIKMIPFPDQPNARVVVNLDAPGALRASLESLVFRFGSAPREPWTIFGQLAAAPLSTNKPFVYSGTLGAEIDSALQRVFDALRRFEPMVGSVVYPEISVIPIAVYRE